jgi:hypothetical protein
MAIVAGLLLSFLLLICAQWVSLWLFPVESFTKIEDVATLENAISFQSYIMLPVLSVTVGFVCGIVGIRRSGLAGVCAVLPIVAIFVAGNNASLYSLGMGALFVALAWVTANAAGNRRNPDPIPDAFESSRIERRHQWPVPPRRTVKHPPPMGTS